MYLLFREVHIYLAEIDAYLIAAKKLYKLVTFPSSALTRDNIDRHEIGTEAWQTTLPLTLESVGRQVFRFDTHTTQSQSHRLSVSNESIYISRMNIRWNRTLYAHSSSHRSLCASGKISLNWVSISLRCVGWELVSMYPDFGCCSNVYTILSDSARCSPNLMLRNSTTNCLNLVVVFVLLLFVWLRYVFFCCFKWVKNIKTTFPNNGKWLWIGSNNKRLVY